MNEVRRAKLQMIVKMLENVNLELLQLTIREGEARQGGTFEDHIDDFEIMRESWQSISDTITRLKSVATLINPD